MIDFYKQILASYGSNEQEIRSAINSQSLNDSQKKSLEMILLNPERRRIYDRAWITLYRIGKLRANLCPGKLDWEKRNPDFCYKNDGTRLLITQLQEIAKKPSNTKKLSPLMTIFHAFIDDD